MKFFSIQLLIKPLLFFIAVTLMTACKNDSEEDPQPNDPNNEPDPTVITIDRGTTYQTIAGYGGANQMWGTQFPNASDMKKAFGMDDPDLGMSIFRIRIASNPDEWSRIVPVSQEALKYGAKIVASPWSPPPSLKSNDSDVGGHLLEENYQAFVDHLNDFVDFMDSNDVDIYAISIQNEPDIQVSYESCDWTAGSMRDFLKDYGHLIEGTKVMAPESFNFSTSFTNILLNEEAAAANLDIVAGHIYGGGLGAFPNAEEQGKEIWMTEYLLNQGATDQWSQLEDEVIWDESVQMLNTIHEAMEYNWNAYIWWYLKRYYSFIGDGDQGTNSGDILKRGYAFSHFSKFVRPGYVRIDADDTDSGLQITAYEGDEKVVVVILNSGEQNIPNVQLSVNGADASSAVAYTTSINKNRDQSDPELVEGNVSLTSLAKSVITVEIVF